MAKKKASSDIVAVTETTPTEQLTHLSVDLGREDLNNMAIKINQIIDVINTL